MGYIDDAFDGLKRQLEITDTELGLASSRHTLIREHIEKTWDLEDHFLTGSYDRHTKTKRLKDVDIFVVIDPKGRQGGLLKGKGATAVAALRDVVSTRWQDVSTDEHVVTINYAREEQDDAGHMVLSLLRRPRWTACTPEHQARHGEGTPTPP